MRAARAGTADGRSPKTMFYRHPMQSGPLTLSRLKFDPAVSSAVFVTATTDFFGFLIFLGLATIVLL